MSIIELKKRCQNLIEDLDNKVFLEDFYEAISSFKESKDRDFWNELTDEQKEDLIKSYDESEDENNLISHEQVMKEAAQWLKR